jgi:enoyl-CoA hydratase/carnithine racemase
VSELIRLDIEPPVAVITLDRADRLNALTYPMIAAFRRAIDEAVADTRVVGVVVTGAGRAFSAGLDMVDLSRATSGGSGGAGAPGGEEARDRREEPDPDELPALFSHLLRVPKPVIAAVNGVAAGGGFVLAMMCDLRFAAEMNGSFTTAFAKRGLVAEHGTSWILPRLVGINRALDLLWSARRIDAAEGYRIGFVDRLVPDDRLVHEACAYVCDLAEHVAPRSLAMMKQEVLRGLSQPIGEALRDVEMEMRASLTHPDTTEGVASFVEKRPPRFAPWTPG